MPTEHLKQTTNARRAELTMEDRQNSSQKEPCLTLTLMDERQDTKP